MQGRFEYAEQLGLFPEEAAVSQAPLGVPPSDAAPPPLRLVPGEGRVATPGSVEAAIGRLLPGHPAVVRYTTNRTIILSLRPGKDGRPVLRAHACFADAPPFIAEAAVRLYLQRAGPGERRRLAHLVTRWHQDAAPPPPSATAGEIAPGAHHDLRLHLDRANRERFGGALDLDITFGGRPARRLMGRHERRKPRSLVVINPVLDHPWITSWYLDFLVFHECLHEVVPPVAREGRILLHPPEFRRREREHPEFDRARDYERWIMGPAWRNLLRSAQKRSATSSQSAETINATPRTRRAIRGALGTGGGDP